MFWNEAWRHIHEDSEMLTFRCPLIADFQAASCANPARTELGSGVSLQTGVRSPGRRGDGAVAGGDLLRHVHGSGHSRSWVKAAQCQQVGAAPARRMGWPSTRTLLSEQDPVEEEREAA
jgi:hypothetical protein